MIFNTEVLRVVLIASPSDLQGQRGLIEIKEYTSHDNPRLYVMPLEVFDQLRGLSDLALNEINIVRNSFRLPF